MIFYVHLYLPAQILWSEIQDFYLLLLLFNKKNDAVLGMTLGGELAH